MKCRRCQTWFCHDNSELRTLLSGVIFVNGVVYAFTLSCKMLANEYTICCLLILYVVIMFIIFCGKWSVFSVSKYTVQFKFVYL